MMERYAVLHRYFLRGLRKRQTLNSAYLRVVLQKTSHWQCQKFAE